MKIYSGLRAGGVFYGAVLIFVGVVVLSMVALLAGHINSAVATSQQPSDLATITITASSSEDQSLVGEWNFLVQNDPVLLQSVTFHAVGSVSAGGIKNIKLIINDVQVGPTLASVTPNGENFFNASTTPLTLPLGDNSVEIFADVASATSSTSGNFKFEIATSSDVAAMDSHYKLPAIVIISQNPASPPPQQEPIAVAPPTYNPVCPGITSSTKNLVFVTHGWNDNANPSGWVNQIAKSISSYIQRHHLSDWAACSYDWSLSAKTPYPWNAFNNARVQGMYVGSILAKQNFTSIHFIAHSAGSNVIRTAADWIRAEYAGSQPKIQLTFLAAYDPSGGASSYGENPAAEASTPFGLWIPDPSWWAEQYVDMTASSTVTSEVSTYDHATLQLHDAYNFEVTPFDRNNPHDSLLAPADYLRYAHAFPHMWYESSTIANFSKYGFPLSLENNYGKYFPGGDCILSDENVSCPTSHGSILTEQSSSYAGNAAINFSDATRNITSMTGSVTHPDSTSELLQDPDPVWSKTTVNTTAAVNIIKFDYEFISVPGAQGVLSASVDGQMVYEADEAFTPSGVNHAKDVWVGDLTPGQHAIVFRFDPSGDATSSVKISNVRFGAISTSTVTNPDPKTHLSGLQEKLLALLQQLLRMLRAW